MNSRFPLPLLLALATLAAPAARASVHVVGGSDLLATPADLANLESWLGQGSITLTNVFDHAVGDGKTGTNFHATLDGQGATITLIQVLSGTGYNEDLNTGSLSNYSIGAQIIGGYNPQSWSSIGDYNYTPADADRTAFIFNLTNSVKQSQKLSTDPSGFGNAGQTQTRNVSTFGPIFGQGADISIQPNLSGGSAASASYGNGFTYSDNPDDILIEIGSTYPGGSFQSYAYYLSIGALEVFTISPFEPAAAVPEPTQVVVWTMLIGATAFRNLRQFPPSGR